jgi:uracil-DNA glycosylase family 4
MNVRVKEAVRAANAYDAVHDPACTRCVRLEAHLSRIRRVHPGYFCGPVPPFGADLPELLVVGLAPGLHGANASGRPFTGDHAGILLYQTLFDFGFSSRPESTGASDGLELVRCRITNAVKCLPPANKPLPEEVRTCNGYLRNEIRRLPSRAVVLALGRIAHDAVLRASDVGIKDYPFAHGAMHVLPTGRRLVASYHCSRYNTQTRRLTPEMFREVFRHIKSLLNGGPT